MAFAPASGVCQGSGEPGAWDSATELPTEFAYTGQHEATEIGLKYYIARWYDSEIGHFIQADTVVLSAGNPSAWNKYSYVSYNPFKYVDPTGHFEEYGPGPTRDLLQDLIERSFGVTFSGSWLIKELQIIHEALLTIKSSVDAFSSEYNLGITGLGWIRSNLNITFAHGSFTNDGKSNYVMKRIMIFIDEDNWMDNAPYSGYSSADYFAESFMFAIYGKELASDDQLKWMLENVFK